MPGNVPIANKPLINNANMSRNISASSQVIQPRVSVGSINSSQIVNNNVKNNMG